jgi:hypothetical protein
MAVQTLAVLNRLMVVEAGVEQVLLVEPEIQVLLETVATARHQLFPALQSLMRVAGAVAQTKAPGEVVAREAAAVAAELRELPILAVAAVRGTIQAEAH